MTETTTYHTVAKVSDIEPGELMYVEAGDAFVCLINLDGEIHAIDELERHQAWKRTCVELSTIPARRAASQLVRRTHPWLCVRPMFWGSGVP